MRRKRERGFWVKKSKEFTTMADSKLFAGKCRLQEGISHVTIEKVEKHYRVSYSVAAWLQEEWKRIGLGEFL